jgi:hypothetical protein
MPRKTCRIALKEWAVALHALDVGRQVILLRKGGIREPGKHFTVSHQEFLLYPTFVHQKDELLKPESQPEFLEPLTGEVANTTVTLTHWVQLYRVHEVTSKEALNRILPRHIWTADYAEKRLHWKPRKPLAVLVVRAYRLNQPRTIPVLSKYLGCASWVELDRDVLLGDLTPVLPEDVFLRQALEVQNDLESERSIIS